MNLKGKMVETVKYKQMVKRLLIMKFHQKMEKKKTSSFVMKMMRRLLSLKKLKKKFLNLHYKYGNFLLATTWVYLNRHMKLIYLPKLGIQ